LWDIFPDQERLGGAGLNFCANLQRLGNNAVLLSAVGRDARGQLALEKMAELGLTTEYVHVVDDLPTGIATVGRTLEGEPSFVIPRPAAFDSVSVEVEAINAAQQSGVDWIYFGTLLQTTETVERFTTDLIQKLPGSRRFFDMNLREGQWNLPLVKRLSGLATILKLNEMEAETLFRLTDKSSREFSLEEFCRSWAAAYGIEVICVTLGSQGCFTYADGNSLTVPGYTVTVADTVGSGDAFAAGFLHGYHRGWPMERTARFANALGALVASRAGATPPWTINEVLFMSGTAG
jgi:fructokinase